MEIKSADGSRIGLKTLDLLTKSWERTTTPLIEIYTLSLSTSLKTQ